MKSIVLLYTILSFNAIGPDKGTITTVAWNMPFSNYENCELFWHAQKESLLNGVLEYARATYKKDMIIKEQGCVTATHSGVAGTQPVLSNHKPKYQAGTSL